MKIKEFLKERGIGYYIAPVVAVLCFITAIVHRASFTELDPLYISTAAIVLFMVGCFVALACLIVPIFVPFLKEWLLPAAPWVLFGAALLGLTACGPSIYGYLQAHGTGKDPATLANVAVELSLLVLITAVLATAGLFFRVTKKEQKVQEK